MKWTVLRWIGEQTDPGFQVLRGAKIKILLALLLLVVAISVFLKQINMVTMSGYLVISSACGLCLVILLPLRKNLLTRSTHREM